MVYSTSGNICKYRSDIDGLRAVAILLVLGFHAFPGKVPGGFIGVDIFFVISGYLITSIIRTEILENRFSFVKFYFRRCRRIFPALTVVLSTVFIAGLVVMTADELKQYSLHTIFGSLFSSNFILWSEQGYFSGPSNLKPLLHLWSLGIEEQFYLFWPIILLFFITMGRVREKLFVSVIIFISFVLSVLLTAKEPSSGFYLLPSRFWELGIGGALAVYSHPKQKIMRPVVSNFLSLLAVAMLIIPAFKLSNESQFPGWNALSPVIGTAIIIYFGATKNYISKWLSGNSLVFIGLISYPLYLWHWPLISMFHMLSNDYDIGANMSRLIRVGVLGVSFILAFLTWKIVEKPVRLKFVGEDRGAQIKAILMLSAPFVVLIFVSAVTIYNGGFIGRQTVSDSDNYVQHRNDLSGQPFDYAYNKYSDCDSEYKTLDKKSWCKQSGEGPVDVAVVGDSHARSLFPALADIYKQSDKNVLLMARCPFMLGIRITTDLSYNSLCYETNEKIFEKIAESHTIKSVIISARGPLYISGKGYGGIENNIGAYLGDVSSTSVSKLDNYESLFLQGYDETFKRLINAGKQVIFIIDVPELGFSPSKCLSIRPFQKQGDLHSCFVTKDNIVSRQKTYRTILNKLQKNYPQIKWFDATATLLDKENNGMSVFEGKFKYQDSNHLSLHGAKIVAKSYQEILLKTLKQD